MLKMFSRIIMTDLVHCRLYQFLLIINNKDFYTNLAEYFVPSVTWSPKKTSPSSLSSKQGYLEPQIEKLLFEFETWLSLISFTAIT